MKDLLSKIKINENTLSNFLSVLVFVLVAVLLIGYFRSVNKSNQGSVNEKSAQVEMTPEKLAQMTVEEVAKSGFPAKYTIKRGDSLWKISQAAYGSGYDWTKIYEANKSVLSDPGLLSIGTEITLPQIEAKEFEYTVVKGNNLWSIAGAFCGDGHLYTQIASQNNISNPSLIEPGIKLKFSCR